MNHAQRLLDSLSQSGATETTDVIGAVETLTGRPIEVREAPFLVGEPVCGLWIGFEARDLLLHVPTGSALASEQIVFHELGHIVLGHDGDTEKGRYLGEMLDGVDDDAVVRVLGRGSFIDERERAAESFADRLADVLRTNRRGSTPFSRVFS